MTAAGALNQGDTFIIILYVAGGFPDNPNHAAGTPLEVQDMKPVTKDELIALLKSVFPPMDGDRKMAILVDLPGDLSRDNPDWRARRQLALEWFRLLQPHARELDLQGIELVAYEEVGSNNADLPRHGYRFDHGLPDHARQLAATGSKTPFSKLFEQFQLFLAPTEYSTTAPMKIAARQYGFRAATMPGFSLKMIPAMRIDYEEVNRRVTLIKEKLDQAHWINADFLVDGKTEFHVRFDIRFRSGHSSSGRFPLPGTAGNFPSGEAYIVPYEGELESRSGTEGVLPVQIEEDVVLFPIHDNRATGVSCCCASDGCLVAGRERQMLDLEPAYGNMAEIGFGVLADFGLSPIQEVLLDEKLGFHVAFGRSDHFGGSVGPADFREPTRVIHLDRIYIPETQPRIALEKVILVYPDKTTETVIQTNRYVVF